MIKPDSLEVDEIHPVDLSDFNGKKNEEKFFPHGAIAFFILLIALCLVIWFGIYFLMLDRI